MDFQPPSDAEIQRLFDSPGTVPPGSFELALVLGGTVSAGAYTAGVMDFLVHAFDCWSRARDAGEAVPNHKTTVRFVTGTSGGGVNAAIFARAMNYGFPTVVQSMPAAEAAANPFYDAWVNHVDISLLLGTSDLDAPGATIVSLLDAEPLDTMANATVEFVGTALPKPRDWIAAPLGILLTLTNLNGMPYRIEFGSMTMPDGSAVNLQQSYVAHADYARFTVAYEGHAPAGNWQRPDAFVLGFDPALTNAMKWTDFAQFALGTAAFPVGLKPRALSRPLTHYQYRLNDEPPPLPAQKQGDPPHYWPLVPDWAALEAWYGAGGILDSYSFTAVDGGVCDNEPIELARQALAGLTGSNPRGGDQANRAVLLIDPFAGESTMANPVPPDILSTLGALLGTVVSQLRYDTRDLLLAADPEVFSRFMITAQRSDASGSKVGDYALATAGLDAFIGFACADFRRHDYLLGRKNCQDYLRNIMVLPATNPLFAAWRDAPFANEYEPPGPAGAGFLPIIPLVGDAAKPEQLDPWPAGKLDPETLRAPIEKRFAQLLSLQFAKGPLTSVLTWLVGKIAEGSAANYIIGLMKTALAEWKLDVGGS